MHTGGKKNTLLRFSIGSKHRMADDPVSALNHLRQVVLLDPEYSTAWKLLGRALVESGQPAVSNTVPGRVKISQST